MCGMEGMHACMDQSIVYMCGVNVYVCVYQTMGRQGTCEDGMGEKEQKRGGGGERQAQG